ncbi:MAG: DMT family transporter [Byssovorax sp.]
MSHSSANITPPGMPRAAVAAALLICLLFGGDQVSRKIVLHSVPALTGGAFTYSLSALAIGVYAAERGIPLMPRTARTFGLHLLSGLLSTLLNGLGLIGLRVSTAGRGSIFFYAYPLFVTLFASTFVKPREPLGSGRLLGSVIALGGLGIVFADRLRGSAAVGDGLILISAVVVALQILHIRRVTREEHPVAAIFWQVALSAPMFWIVAGWLEAPIRVPALPGCWAALLYQGFGVVALGFVGRAELVRRHGASLVTSFFFLTPIVGVLLSAALLHEAIGAYMLVGAPLVVLGVFLVQRPPRNRSA